MVCLDHKGVHFTQPFDQHFRWIAEISNEAEPAVCGMKSVTDRIDGVVRHGKGLDGDIADTELGTGPKNPPVFVLSESGTADGFGGLRIAIDRDRKFPAQYF